MPKKQISTKQTQSTKTDVVKSSVQENSVRETSSNQMSDSNKKILAALLISALVALALFMAYRKFFVAAYVNGEAISRVEIIKQLEKQGGKNVLDQLVTEKLITQEAKKRDISITQNDVNKETKTIEATVTKQGMTLDQALQSQGLTKEQFNKEVKIQLMLQKMVKPSVITDKQVAAYIETNKDQLTAQQQENPTALNTQIKAQLTQQTQQTDIQKFVTDLKAKAKIITVKQY